MGIVRLEQTEKAELEEFRRMLLSCAAAHVRKDGDRFGDREAALPARNGDVLDRMVCVTSGVSYLGIAIVNQLLVNGYSVRIIVDNEGRDEGGEGEAGEEADEEEGGGGVGDGGAVDGRGSGEDERGGGEAGAEEVAGGSHRDTGEDGAGDGGDSGIPDVGGGEVEVVADDGEERRCGEGGDEAGEEGDPGEAERAHVRRR